MNGTFSAENDRTHGIICFTGPDNSAVVASAYLGLAVANSDSHAKGHIWFFGGAGGVNPDPAPVLEDQDFELLPNTVWSRRCPDNTCYIVVWVEDTNQMVDWYVEPAARV